MTGLFIPKHAPVDVIHENYMLAALNYAFTGLQAATAVQQPVAAPDFGGGAAAAVATSRGAPTSAAGLLAEVLEASGRLHHHQLMGRSTKSPQKISATIQSTWNDCQRNAMLGRTQRLCRAHQYWSRLYISTMVHG